MISAWQRWPASVTTARAPGCFMIVTSAAFRAALLDGRKPSDMPAGLRRRCTLAPTAGIRRDMELK
jgi:hypothetical protein